jgi:hypothetical protein
MRTCCLILIAIFLGLAAESRAQYPIPSSNVLVRGLAAFHENDQTARRPEISPSKIRNVQVHTTGIHAILTAQASYVVVYSLDGQTVYGPYRLTEDKTFSHSIDNRLWGVLVYSPNEVFVDVWIE